MVDTPENSPPYPARVDLSEARDVQYWTRALGASEAVLREAVAAVGDDVEQVREYLGSGS